MSPKVTPTAESRVGASLRIEGLCSGYTVDILHGIDLEVRPGEIVALLGANGAGKSTLAKTILGALPTRKGQTLLDDEVLSGLATSQVCSRGVALVPEGRRLFARRTVEQNLLVAAWPRRDGRDAIRTDIDALMDRFPILRERRHAHAGSLSGGEGQLLAFAMALVVRPRLIILDEPSLGLSPVAVKRIAREIMSLRETGTSVLLIEQNARTALAIADRAYVLELGQIVLEGTSDELSQSDVVRAAYLGI